MAAVRRTYPQGFAVLALNGSCVQCDFGQWVNLSKSLRDLRSRKFQDRFQTGVRSPSNIGGFTTRVIGIDLFRRVVYDVIHATHSDPARRLAVRSPESARAARRPQHV